MSHINYQRWLQQSSVAYAQITEHFGAFCNVLEAMLTREKIAGVSVTHQEGRLMVNLLGHELELFLIADTKDPRLPLGEIALAAKDHLTGKWAKGPSILIDRSGDLSLNGKEFGQGYSNAQRCWEALFTLLAGVGIKAI